MKYINKAHQHVPELYTAAEKCFRADIPATYNLILGYPGEGHRHRIETVRVMTDIAAQYPMTDIAAQYPSVDFSPNRFAPYLGISIWPDLQPLGVVEPTTLAGWARVDLNSNNLPWLRGGALQSLNRAVQYLVSVNRVSAARSPLAPWPLRRTLGFVHRLLSWRLRHGFFDAPMELWLLMARRWLVLRRSLLTGQPLSRELITNDGGLSTCSS